MQALFRLLFEAFNPLFFKSFVQHREFLALKAKKREKLNAIPFQTLTGKEKMKSNPSQRDKLRSTLSRTIFMYLESKAALVARALDFSHTGTRNNERNSANDSDTELLSSDSEYDSDSHTSTSENNSDLDSDDSETDGFN